MESLRENKALLYSLLGSGSFLLCLISGAIPEINEQFQIIDIDTEVSLFFYKLVLICPTSAFVLDVEGIFLIRL